MLTCDRYLMPETLHEALRLWTDAEAGGRLVAGATDTLPWARQGRAGNVHVPTIVDLSRVDGLDAFGLADVGRVRLGANVVFQQFLEEPFLKEHLTAMPQCAIWFADDQIRRQATLAGNIVNASPAADGTPPMLALDAEIELARLDGDDIARRTVPVADFVTGPGRTVIDRGEIVTAITCRSSKGYGGSFEKVGQRRSLVISVVCAACNVKTSADGRTFDDVRLALGGIGPVPVRLDEVETYLRGKTITPDTISTASDLPVDRVASRTRRDYRRDVVRGFVERAIVDALADCGIGSGGKAAERTLVDV